MKDPVKDILNKITSFDSESNYKIDCAYSDGKEKTLLVITFYQKNESSIIGKVTFCHQTGQVCRYYYKHRKFTYTDDIVNLLLDIYSDELSRHQVNVKI